MSIWVSAAGPDIKALENDCDTANYDGDGPRYILVDVATTGAHDLIRLLLIDERGGRAAGTLDVAALLDADAAGVLGARLTAAGEAMRARSPA